MDQVGTPQFKVSPGKDKFVWETDSSYSKRNTGPSIEVAIGFYSANGGFVALGQDELNRAFLLENSPDNMQGNLLEMLVKSQIVAPVFHLMQSQKDNDTNISRIEIQIDVF